MGWVSEGGDVDAMEGVRREGVVIAMDGVR
jgi:hypothetical protein